MEVGKLDRRITIRSYTIAQDTFGENVKTFTNLATVWAKFVGLAGREGYNTDQRVASFDAKFVIRYRADVTPQHKIVFDGATYDIKALNMIGRKRYLEILTTNEVVG